MTDLETRNQKIINAVIEKAKSVCPGSLALIGIYGSFQTGDYYEKSDLDLLVLINDEQGRQLSCTFIQEDSGVGHDIYCTTWENLQEDSLYNNPNISKLMDSEIVYFSDRKYLERLNSLRKKVRDKLLAPLSEEDYRKAENFMKEAEHFYLLAMLAEDLSDIWAHTGYALNSVENAIAMLNKKYFRYGAKRVYEELALMEIRPCHLCEMIENVLSGTSAGQIKESLTALIRETMGVFQKTKASVPSQKKTATADSLKGTYEEMYSNWRNKMYLAADEGNRHLAFMSMLGLQAMISEVGNEVEIAGYDVFDGYHPQNPGKSAQAFDEIIAEYAKEYQKVNLKAARYPDIDAFIAQYSDEEHPV